jgi:nucleotide-binding universal stress UspA family protein
VDDVVAWSLLALVLAVVASAGAWDLPRILALSAVFVATMLLVVRPMLERLVADRYRRTGRLTPDILAVILVGLLVSSFLTAKIGIHQIFGAFLFGAVLPREGTAGLFHEILERLENVSVLLLLPVFFIATGLDANVRGIGADGIWQLGLILLVAIAGKFVGAAAGARVQGIPGRQAATIGVLMNTRGLTELVILNVGLAFGVLDSQLFTMLVVMAIVTTVMTEPLLRIVYPDTALARDIAAAERAAVGTAEAYRVLVAVGDPTHAARMADLAVGLVGDQEGGEVVLTRFTPRAQGVELGTGLVTELAEMEESMEALRQLAERVNAGGVRCVLRYQFSDDVAGDLVAQASSVGAKLLLVGAPRASTEEGRLLLEQFSERLGLDFDDFISRLFHEAGCDVAVLVHPFGPTVPPGPDHPLVVAVADGTNDAAAVELAVRTARTRRAELRLVDAVEDRRGGRWLADLADEVVRLGPPCTWAARGDGLAAEIARESASAALVVTGAGSGELGPVAEGLVANVHVPVLVVRARAAEDRRGLGSFVERLHQVGATSDAPTG